MSRATIKSEEEAASARRPIRRRRQKETMAQTSEIPEAEEISAGWLSQKLQAAGYRGAEVRAFTAETVGTGQAARCFRFALEYADPQPSFPQAIIGKFPSADPNSRQAGKEQKTYMREVNFYRHLRSRVSIQLPKCYAAEIEGDGPEFALLLEDVSPARQGDQISGCSPALARSAILGLVGLHGPSWGDAGILGLDWLDEGDPLAHSQFITGIYQAGLPHFVERCGDALTRAELDMVEAVARAPLFPSEPPVLKRRCLIHSDYRLDNMLIDESRSPPDMFIVDWQTIVVGNPMRDVAYFLGGCLLPDDRAAHETAIVGDYHAALVAAGVADYGRDECWDDYRRASFHGLMNAVVAMLFVTKTERGDRLFATMAQRHARQAVELGAGEFLS